ncbi:MAG: hypothetical protein FD167_1085 [bacterium]|nr:MAG: hypothetical protein FD167_1085 [bacterium]
MKAKYLVIFERAEKNWSAYFPQIEGCGVTGKTLDKTKHLAQEVLEFHLEGLLENGCSIPNPSQIDLDTLYQNFPFEYAGYIEIELDLQAIAA